MDEYQKAADIERARALLKAMSPECGSLFITIIEGDPHPQKRGRTARGRVYKDAVERVLENEMVFKLKATLSAHFTSNVALAAVFYRATRRRVDSDNLVKFLCDSGTKAEIWQDDSQITAQCGIVEYDPEHPRTVIALGAHKSTMDRTIVAKSTPSPTHQRKMSAKQLTR